MAMDLTVFAHWLALEEIYKKSNLNKLKNEIILIYLFNTTYLLINYLK